MTGAGAVQLELPLRWISNILAVTLLPAQIGMTGQPMGLFLVYAVLAGMALTMGESGRYLWMAPVRADFRSYLRVRIGLVAICGMPALLAGAMLGRAV